MPPIAMNMAWKLWFLQRDGHLKCTLPQTEPGPGPLNSPVGPRNCGYCWWRTSCCSSSMPAGAWTRPCRCSPKTLSYEGPPRPPGICRGVRRVGSSQPNLETMVWTTPAPLWASECFSQHHRNYSHFRCIYYSTKAFFQVVLQVK